jgi:hypothetical protein
MTKNFLFWLNIIWLFLLSCTSNTENYTGKKLFKVDVTDNTLRGIIHDYTKAYSFEGKGVYLININNVDDTIKYYIGTVFNKKSIDLVLKNKPYYLYDTINRRIVIIDTKLEDFILPDCSQFEKDTILSEFLESNGSRMKREVYFMEFKKVGDSLSRKVIYFDPF